MVHTGVLSTSGDSFDESSTTILITPSKDQDL
jgi:hypothetical protein